MKTADNKIAYEGRQPRFNPTFTIEGKVFHHILSLLPAEGEKPKFSQLYFYDTEQKSANRLDIMYGLDDATVTTIQYFLHQHNTYINSRKAGLELMHESPDIRLVLHAWR